MTRQLQQLLLGAALWVGTAWLGYAEAGSGAITGVIRIANGTHVARAGVRISLIASAVKSGAAAFSAIAPTAADGTFSMNGMPASTFTICPTARDTSLLSPCLWGREPTVTLAAGQTAVVPPIQLQAAVDLHMRVTDPACTLAALEGKVADADLLISVISGKGTMAHVNPSASDAPGYDHHLTVPTDTDLSQPIQIPTAAKQKEIRDQFNWTNGEALRSMR